MTVDVEKTRKTIKSLLYKAEADLSDALDTGNEEEAASLTYLIAEYEEMLEELDDYYGISKT